MILATDMDEEDLEGSMEADTGELARYKSHRTESESPGLAGQKGRKFESAKVEVDYNSENHLDDIKEECSRTEEGQRMGTMRGDVEVTDPKISRSPMDQRKKSKKVLFGRGTPILFEFLLCHVSNPSLLL